MPLYEYECDACGHRFEVIQKFSDPAIEKCPKCGSMVRKLQSAPAFQFKGTGWYITDYARKGQEGGAGKTETKDSSNGAAASGEKAESAPGAEKSATSDKGKSAASDKTEKTAASDKGTKPTASGSSSND
jgi:putative FmdB family regulatory protein